MPKGYKLLKKINKIYGKNMPKKLNGFDDAIIGLNVEQKRLIYSTTKCIKILKKTMPTNDAIDHFYLDVYNGKTNKNQPLFCEDFLIKK